MVRPTGGAAYSAVQARAVERGPGLWLAAPQARSLPPFTGEASAAPRRHVTVATRDEDGCVMTPQLNQRACLWRDARRRLRDLEPLRALRARVGFAHEAGARVASGHGAGRAPVWLHDISPGRGVAPGRVMRCHPRSGLDRNRLTALLPSLVAVLRCYNAGGLSSPALLAQTSACVIRISPSPQDDGLLRRVL
jgi:hypothetical protein